MMVRVIETSGLGVERSVWDQGADGVAMSEYDSGYCCSTNCDDNGRPVINHSGKKARTTSSKRKLVEVEPVEYPQPPGIDLNKLKSKK